MASERRGADGPDRADQRPRRFDLRAAAGGAGARPHSSAITRPTGWRWRQASVFATVQPLDGARQGRRPFHPRRSASARRCRRSTWCCCARTRRSTSPTSPPRICSSASIRRRWWSTIRRRCATRRKRCSSPNFPTLMPPTLLTRDLAEIKAFRAEHGDIVMKPLYGHGGGAVFRLTRDDLNFGSLYDMFAVDLPRALGDPEIPARGARRRQAHHPGRRRICRRGQPRAGGRRPALQHGARRLAEGHRADAARARDLRRPSARRCASAGCCSSAST